MLRVRVAASACVLAGALLAQVPEGTVAGEDGKPIAGARVRIAFRAGDPEQERELEDLLAAEPLPVVVSNAEGKFSLPLPALAKGLGHEALFGLVVEKPGYQSWRERLSGRLDLYRGSRVVLRAHREADRAAVEVDAPEPGMVLLVERVRRQGLSDDATLGGEALEFGFTDGRARPALPLLPSPCAVDAGNDWAQVGYRAWLLSPGRSSEPFALAPGSRVRLDKPTAAPRVVATCRRSDGAEVANARGLFRCPDQRLRWFPLRDAKVVADRCLTLVALCADGCAATPDVERAVLPVLEPKAKASLRLTDAEGKDVRDARAVWRRLVEWAGAERPLDDMLPRARQLRAGAGTLTLDVPDEPGFLVVDAPGHRQATIFEPRALRGTPPQVLGKVPAGALRVRVTCGGEPLAGAVLWAPQLLAGRVLRTDADGNAEADRVPAGNAFLRVCSPECPVGESHGFGKEVPAGGIADLDIALVPAAVHEVHARTGRGEPVPFAPLGYVTDSEGWEWLADSFGNLRVAQSGGQKLELREVTPSARFLRARGTKVTAGNPATVLVGDSTLVLVRFEPGIFNRQRTWISNGRLAGGSNTWRVDPCACGVLLRWSHAGKPTYVVELEESPPLVITHEEVVAAGSPLVEIDRRTPARRIPLALTGDVPADLGDLRVAPHGIGKFQLLHCTGEMLARDPAGKLFVVSRDSLAQTVTVLHPDCLPATIELPAGPCAGVEAKLERGARATLQFEVARAYREEAIGTNLFAIESGGGWLGRRSVRGPLPLAALRSAKPGERIRVACPAALPPGPVSITLSSICGEAKVEAEVEACKPLTIDLGVLK